MTFQTSENDKNNRGETKRKNLDNEIRSTWLGMRDSNPRMPGPEPGALPLGQSPISDRVQRGIISLTRD
jgi:hypothetical protein